MSLAALVGLIFYTLYTRRMMWIAQDSRNAELMPYFVVDAWQDLDAFSTSVTLTNLGAHAVNVTAWEQRVSDGFSIGSTFLEKTRNYPYPEIFFGTLRKDTSKTIAVHHGSARKHLAVLDCLDTAQRRHQFAILRSQRADFSGEFHAKMLFQVDYLPPFQAWVMKMRTRWNIHKAKVSKGGNKK